MSTSNVGAKWPAWAPQLLSVLRIICALMFLQAGTIKLFGWPMAVPDGANPAIFSVVRGVLSKPLTNRDEDRLVYIRQTARGIGAENANFSVPEIRTCAPASGP